MKALLEGPRVRLRALEPEDLSIMYTIENDTTTWDVCNLNVPYSYHVLKQYITDTQYDLYADKQLRLMIVRLSDGAVIGAIDLSNFEPFHSRAEVGIVILETYRGEGYATEALRLLCEYAFDFLNMNQLCAHVSMQNSRSMQLFQSCGFVQCGLLKQWWKVQGDYQDVLIMQQLRPNKRKI